MTPTRLLVQIMNVVKRAQACDVPLAPERSDEPNARCSLRPLYLYFDYL